MNVPNSIIYNSQKKETTQMFTNTQLDKQNTVLQVQWKIMSSLSSKKKNAQKMHIMKTIHRFQYFLYPK